MYGQRAVDSAEGVKCLWRRRKEGHGQSNLLLKPIGPLAISSTGGRVGGGPLKLPFVKFHRAHGSRTTTGLERKGEREKHVWKTR